jgi:hypothetical protein
VDTAFFAAMRAMMADVMSGKNIAENGFINMALAGLAVAFAPLIAARSSARKNAQLATISGALSVLVMARMVETLPKCSRMSPNSLDWESCNPFAFRRLFTNGRGLATLSLVSGFQTYTDPRLMEECAILVMREKLKWSDRAIQVHLSIMSQSIVFGVGAGKFTVRALGRLNHTHMCHLVKIACFFWWSRANSLVAMRAVQGLMVFGQRQRDGVETLMTDVGVAKGMGKGQLEAYKMNWRSISNLLAPLVYARVFVWGRPNNNLGAPFVAAAIFTSFSEAVMLTLREADLTSVLAVK